MFSAPARADGLVRRSPRKLVESEDFEERKDFTRFGTSALDLNGRPHVSRSCSLAKDLRIRGLADAVFVSGAEAAAPADPDRLQLFRDAIAATLLVGSGITAENARSFALADGAIVGSSLKAADGAVDPKFVRAVVLAFKA